MPVKLANADLLPEDLSTKKISRTSQKNNIAKNASGNLKETYYLDNFDFLINFVSSHYQSLLLGDELQLIKLYKKLPTNAQQLFVRLVLRTPDYIRLSKINYPEIDLAPALDILSKAGFVDSNIDSAEYYLPLFTQQELRAAIGVTSAELPSFDSDCWTTPDLFCDSPASKLIGADTVIKVNFKHIIQIFRLLFFGNLHQDFSSFVLRDLGYQHFESYQIEHDAMLFSTREQIQAHLTYYNCMENFDTACEQGVGALVELHHALPQQRIENDKILWRRLDRLNNKIARQLERESALEFAANIYSKSIHPPARERLARIHANSGDTAEALNLCRQIQQSPWDSDELDFASSFGLRLARKTSQCFPAEPKYKPPETALTLSKSDLSVEFSVATHMAKTGKCYYLENNLISGVFGLAFWDIIFAQVNGVFFHPFQSKPADFYEKEFIISREALINERLSEVSNGALNRIVSKHLYHKRGIQNPMVNWGMCRKHIIDLALRRIPAMTWEHLFKQLLIDIRNYRSGQPDLIYFPDASGPDAGNPDTGSPNACGYQFIEVKAPGDKLQKNQLRWMKFFKQQNIPHIVVNVDWAGSSA